MGGFNQLRAMLYKNFKLKSRRPMSTFYEIALPVAVLALMVLFRSQISKKDEAARDFTANAHCFTDGCHNYDDGKLDEARFRNLMQNLDQEVRGVDQECSSGDCVETQKFSPKTIVFAPDTADTRSIANAFLTNFPAFNGSVRFFANEEVLIDYVKDPFYATSPAFPGIYAAVVVKSLVPVFEYSIRMNATHGGINSQDFPRVADTSLADVDNLSKGYNSINWNAYYYNGFVALQMFLEQYAIRLASGYGWGFNGDPRLPSEQFDRLHNYNVSMFVCPFPTPEHVSDPFALVLTNAMGILFCLAYVWPVTRLIRNLVEERESRIKEGMKMMGLTDSVWWMSWALTYLFIFGLSAVLITIMTSANVFEFSDPVLVFAYFGSFAVAAFALGTLIHTFFSRAKTASSIGAFMFIASFFPYFAVSSESVSRNYKTLSCFLAPTCFGLGSVQFAQFESAQQGINFGNWTTERQNFDMATVIAMLWVDSLIYLVLAWYLDNVFPGETGVPKPLWFCLLPSSYGCCRCRRKKPNSRHMELVQVEERSRDKLKASHFEEVSPEVAAQGGISIQGLRKSFTTGGQSVHAVKDLHLDMYANQITALLGHNGAGKTTTISMLCGLIPMSAGDATVFGYKVSEDMPTIRNSMGVCPQHDILFDDLTVVEHLNLFATLKGMRSSQIKGEVEQIIQEVGLTEKRHEASSTLSGGQKRKLSVAIALIGGSKFVLLDEPTSGMDVYSRRSTWNLLEKYKHGRVIVLTTHFMDEADQLGDRIAIMGHGQLKCVGSPLFLKHLYGVGYTLTITKRDRDDDACDQQVLRYVKQHVPKAEILSNAGAEISFRLPFAAAPQFSRLFTDIDAEVQKNGVVSNYGISATTLEEVFLRVAQDDEAQRAHERRNSLRQYQRAMSKSQIRRQPSLAQDLGIAEQLGEADYEEFEDVKQGEDIGLQERKQARRASRSHSRLVANKITTGLFWTHVYALLVKRFHNAKRDLRQLFFLIVLPVCITVLGLALLRIIPTSFPDKILSPGMYDTSVTRFPFNAGLKDHPLFAWNNTQVVGSPLDDVVRGVDAAASSVSFAGYSRGKVGDKTVESPSKNATLYVSASSSITELYMDGVLQTLPNAATSTTGDSLPVLNIKPLANNGEPVTIAMKVTYSPNSAHPGLIARVLTTDGEELFRTASYNHMVRATNTDPGAGWHAAGFDDHSWLINLNSHQYSWDSNCNDAKPGTPTQLASASWIWPRGCTDNLVNKDNQAYTTAVTIWVRFKFALGKENGLVGSPTAVSGFPFVSGTTTNAQAVDVAVDGGDAATYVAAYIDNAQIGPAIGTRIGSASKFNSTGHLQWGALMGPEFTFYHEAKAIAIAPPLNTVFVMGTGGGVWLNKFHMNNGTRFFHRRQTLNTQVDGMAYASTMHALFFAGRGASQQVNILRLDPDTADVLWTVTLASNGFTNLRSLAVHPTLASVYVAGDTQGSVFNGTQTVGLSGSQDAWATKITSQGQWVWTRIIGTNQTSDQDYIGAISVSPSSLVCVSGRLKGRLFAAGLNDFDGTTNFTLRTKDWSAEPHDSTMSGDGRYYVFAGETRASLFEAVSPGQQSYVENRDGFLAYLDLQAEESMEAVLGHVAGVTPYTVPNGAKLNVTEFSQWLLTTNEQFADARFNAFHVTASEVLSSRNMGRYEVTMFFNTTAVHSLPIGINSFHNGLLRKTHPTRSIIVHNHPLPFTSGQEKSFGLMAAVILATGFAFIPSSYVAFAVKERELAAKHQQVISGVNFVAYWLSNLMWDTFMYSFPAVMSIAVVAFFGVDELTGDNLPVTIIGVVLYGPAVTSFTYCFSFLFKSHSTAQAVMILVYVLTGILLLNASFFLDVIPSTKDTNFYLKFIYRLFPNFAFGEVILNLFSRENVALTGTLKGRWHMDVSGYPFMFMAGSTVVYFCVALVIEHVLTSPKVLSSLQRGVRVQDAQVEDDPDVARERVRVQSMPGGQGDPVMVCGLRKEYGGILGAPSKVAVKDLWFGVRRGEAFGFLGVNGAGKTTTLSMLVNEVTPTAGHAYLMGYDTNTQQEDIRKHIGYCPQFGGLMPTLTARETLSLYARIKGIPSKQVPVFVKAMISKLKLEEYADRPCGGYSGGNKRKLSVGIALIGDPGTRTWAVTYSALIFVRIAIVFLDEPSTGVDPASRREMWNLISTTMAGRSLILTTHSLEECEALCGQKIGIMVSGRLRCLGSAQHLKTKYGNGFQVDAKAVANRALDLGVWMNAHFPGCVLLEQQDGGYMKYKVPKSVSLASVFGQLETAKREGLVAEYACSEYSLEQVFIGFAKEQEEERGPVKGIM